MANELVDPLSLRCENIDAGICQRFSPGKDGGACLRCGHGETCHSVGEAPTGRLVCCWHEAWNAAFERALDSAIASLQRYNEAATLHLETLNRLIGEADQILASR